MSGDARCGLEIELKLTGAPAELAAAFRGLGGGTPRPAGTVSTYCDTDDGRLWHRGFTLRLRREKVGHSLTLKREAGDKLRRGEWTARTAEPTANLGLLPADAPRREIGTILPEELRPRFVTDVARRKKELQVDGARIEIVLDNGRIEAGDAERALSEMEFELLDGSLAAMLKTVRTTLRRHALKIETRSKASRGRQLVADAPPPFAKAGKPALRRTDTVGGALAAIVAETAVQILANLAAAEDGRDPEGVHQLRVGLRRLRSALSLLTDARSAPATAFVDDAKWALRALGPARDRDVFVAETLPPVMAANADTPGLARLAALAERQTHAAYEDVRRLLGERRFNLFLVDLLLLAEGEPALARDPDAPLGPLATTLLKKRHRKVLKAGRAFDRLSNPERHEVRIALKKLRYACDYFQTLWPRRTARPYLAAMAELQDTLGRLNDADVATNLAATLAADDPLAAVGAAVVRGWYGHRLRAVDARMVEAWRAFAAMRPFWRQ